MNRFFICFLFLLLIGCSTIIPKRAIDTELKPDSSTPTQYISVYNSGIIGFILSNGKIIYRYDIKPNEKIGEINYTIVTNDKLEEYNSLIDKYKIQFLKKESGKLLERNAGVSIFIDKFGNSLWKINAEHVSYFGILKDWERNNMPVDSGWDKFIQGAIETKDKILN